MELSSETRNTLRSLIERGYSLYRIDKARTRISVRYFLSEGYDFHFTKAECREVSNGLFFIWWGGT
jgi:hypothetical protein